MVEVMVKPSLGKAILSNHVVLRSDSFIKSDSDCSPFSPVQLIFSLTRYEAVIDAYLDGLEASGLSDLSRVTSVASFFVSRVDTLIDKMLEKIGTPEALDLRGKVTSSELLFLYTIDSHYILKNP
jgi:hypothetical protein